MSDSLKQLTERMNRFVEERHWQEHQSPKNLVMALSAEAGELSELFMWLTREESWQIEGDKKQAVAEELADILNYAVRIADELDIDLVAAAHAKCDKNDGKYPAERFQEELSRPDQLKFLDKK